MKRLERFWLSKFSADGGNRPAAVVWSGKFEASAARLIKVYCQKDKRQGSKDTCLIKRNLVKQEQSSLRELSYKKESVRML